MGGMVAVPLNPAAWLKDLAVGLVEVYQRRISPFKGFRCAHRALRGGRSCSEHAKQVARRWGLWKLWPLLKRRLARCAEAKQLLDCESKQKPAAAAAEPEGEGWKAKAAECGMEIAGEACIEGCPVGMEALGHAARDGLGACDCGP
jgi:uncharacterized protein